MSHEQPRARYRPLGEACLQVNDHRGRFEFALDDDVTDLPPPRHDALAAPTVRATIRRVPGGHRLVPRPGATVRVNGYLLSREHVLRGGDEIELDGFAAVFTAARQELPFPMKLVVWPPEGPAVEIRSHKAVLTVGMAEGDVLIDDEAIDDLHCVIKRFRSGLMQIEDRHSYNGVYVDGRRISDTGSLRDGAEIRIGNSTIKVWSEVSEAGDFGALLTGLPVGDDDEPAEYGDRDDDFRGGGRPRPAGDDVLQPYAMELGPEYARRKERTFYDDVPTRLEKAVDSVAMRPTRRSERDGYSNRKVLDPDDERVPDWAPRDANAPRPATGARDSGTDEARNRSDTGDRADTGRRGWGRAERRGLTLVHDLDAPDPKSPKSR